MHESNIYFEAIQLWKQLSSLFDWQQHLVHKRIQMILYIFLSCQEINFSCLWDHVLVRNSWVCVGGWFRMHQISAKLPLKCSRSHDVSHISFYSKGFCCQWVLYSSYIPRPKMIIDSLARWSRKSKDVAHPLRANGKFVIPNLSHHFVLMPPQAIPGSDLGLIELMPRALYDKFAASISVWISCGGWWILYRQLVLHRAYFTLLCRMKSVKIQWNT